MYHKSNPWYFVAGLIVILSLLFTIVSGKNMNSTLETYQGNGQINTDMGEEIETEKTFETQIYTNDKIALSMEVPADFNMVIKSGHDTFVHIPSGTSIQIQVNEYDPAINNCDASVLSEKIAGEGYSFMSFTRLDNSSYEVIYQKTDGVVYDYIEEVYWDRDNIVVLKFIVEDGNYDKFSDEFVHAVNTFSWIKENPIPEGYYLYYCADGNYEFGVPMEWSFSGAGNTYYAADQNTGSQYMVQCSINENGTDLSTLTATDMTGIINTGKSSFMLENFHAESGKARARASFLDGNIKYVDEYTILSKDNNLYYIIFEYENGLLSEETINDLYYLFRIF